jgi:hypothetical protein
MFRWYRNAAKCYVYLSDVSRDDYSNSNPSSQSWEPDLRKSRWFTRGWTLQELLAPSLVEFFCSNGKRLGDKRSLELQIYEITGIAVQALQGTPLSDFSVNERMSWAKTRQTKREEDRAYSLLGIFDIHMPLIYGEGAASALKRLQEEIDKSSRLIQACKYQAMIYCSLAHKQRHICRLTVDYQPARSIAYRTPLKRPSTPTRSNMSPFASPIPVSTFSERYTTGQTDKMGGVFSG